MVEVSVVRACPAIAGRSARNRPRSSPARCWLSPAEPPLPKKKTRPPRRTAWMITSATRAVTPTCVLSTARLTAILSRRTARILNALFADALLAKEDFRKLVELRIHRLELPGGLADGHRDDLIALQGHHRAELAGQHELDRLDAEPRPQNPAEGRRAAAPLNVPKHRDAGLKPGLLLDQVADPLPHPAQPDVPELVELASHGPCRAGGLNSLTWLSATLRGGELRSFRDDHDGEILPALVALLDGGTHLIDVNRKLREEDDARPPRQPRVQRNPASVPAHHLENHDPMMALGRRVQPV